MKKILIALCAILTSTIFAQDIDVNGIWVGVVYDDNDEAIRTLLLEIEGDVVSEWGYNSDTEEYFPYSYKIQKFFRERNNAIYFWMNQGGVWSETQSYHISFLNENNAEIIWNRQVNNIKEGEDNDIWEMYGTGTLERIVENVYRNPFVQARSSEFFTIGSITVESDFTEVVLFLSNETENDFSGTFHGPGHEYAMYITDSNRSSRYRITAIDGVEFDVPFIVEAYDYLEITLYFEPIGDLKHFDIIEPATGPGAWSFYGISLEQ